MAASTVSLYRVIIARCLEAWPDSDPTIRAERRFWPEAVVSDGWRSYAAVHRGNRGHTVRAGFNYHPTERRALEALLGAVNVEIRNRREAP
jgi:hypothetical protein